MDLRRGWAFVKEMGKRPGARVEKEQIVIHYPAIDTL
jgi:hypothetical protein